MKNNGWEHHDLEKEIGASNMAQLLTLFKRGNEEYIEMCGKYVDLSCELTDEAKSKTREQCEFLYQAKVKIALEIAERMTETTKVQREVIPTKWKMEIGGL